MKSFPVLFAGTFVSFLLLSCGADPAPLPDPGPPPPAPEVSANDTLLDRMGKEIEGALRAGEIDRLLPLTDYVRFVERIYYPDSLSSLRREDVEEESRKKSSDGGGAAIWKDFISAVELGVRVDYLGVRREKGTRLLYRLIFPSGSLSYLELLLGEDSGGMPIVVDFYEYLHGEFSSRTTHRLVAADDRDPLLQLLNINDAGADAEARLSEAIGLLIREEYDKANYILNEMPEPYRSLRQAEAVRLVVTRGRGGENAYRKGLSRFLKKYGEEPGVEIVLYEQAVNFGRPEEALEWVDKLDGLVNDPYLNVLRAYTYLQLGRDSLVRVLSDSVLALDLTFVLPHRILLLSALDRQDHPAVLEQLRHLVALNDRWDELPQLMEHPATAPFRASPEYAEAKEYIGKITVSRSSKRK